MQVASNMPPAAAPSATMPSATTAPVAADSATALGFKSDEIHRMITLDEAAG